MLNEESCCDFPVNFCLTPIPHHTSSSIHRLKYSFIPNGYEQPGTNAEFIVEKFNVNTKSEHAFYHFNNYLPRIKEILRNIDIEPDKFPLSSRYFISEEIQARLNANKHLIIHVSFQNIYGYYCIDLYVKEENSQIVYEMFEKEINIGYIRITNVLPENESNDRYIETILSRNGEILGLLSLENRSDPNLVKIACLQNCMSFRFASDSLKNDKLFVQDLVENVDGMILQFASLTLQNDEEIALKAVKNNGWAPLRFRFRIKMKIRTRAYSQRLDTLMDLAKALSFRNTQFNATKNNIEIYDHDGSKYPAYILYNRLISIPITIVEPKEDEIVVLLSSSSNDL